MSDEIPNECIVVVVCGKDVRLDPEYMKFNEANINKFMEQEYGWIDYFGKQLELAQKELALASLEYDVLYNEKYIQVKDQGNGFEFDALPDPTAPENIFKESLNDCSENDWI